MGIIENQSKKNLFILVFAVFFGAINNLVLFPMALSKEEWGVIRFLPSIAIILSNVALLGSPQLLIRYMPAYVKKNHSNSGLFWFILKLTFTGLFIVLFALWLLKPQILGLYEENASSLSIYYVYLFPLLILNTLFELLSAYTRAYFLSVYQLFLREIVHRVVQAVLLLLVVFKVIDFELFIVLFVFSMLLNIILLVLFLMKQKMLDMKPNSISFQDQLKMIKYGSANLLTGLGATVTNRIDSLMVTALVSMGAIATGNGGLEAVAIYAFGAYLVSVIEMPARAVSSIANTIIAKAWEKKDLSELDMIYKKTSINQLIVGCLLFILIWAGIDELFELIGKYEEAKWVVFFLGIGKIINISSGAMGSIIVSSKFYLYSMYSMILLAIITYFSNLYFIPIYGLVGAAIATVFSLIIYYFFSFLLLKVKTGLQPFTFKSVILLLMSVGLFLFANYLDFGLYPIIEIIVDSMIIASIYIALIYALVISSEMNQTIKNIFKKTFKLIARKVVFPLIMKLGWEKRLNKAPMNSILNVMYHGVVESNDARIIRNINAKKFERHIVYLKENFEIISLEESLKRMRGEKGIGKSLKQSITLSFDDGYSNNLSSLLPIIEKYDIPASVYILGHIANEKESKVITVWSNYIDFLVQKKEFKELHRILKIADVILPKANYYEIVKGKSSEQMKELLVSFSKSEIVKKAMESYSPEVYSFLSIKEIQDLSKSPLITIGSHAYWHCNIGIQSQLDQEFELKESKRILESLIGEKVNSIAYPDGSYTRETIQLAQNLGYKDQWAVSYNYRGDATDDRIYDRFGVPTQTTFESNMVFLQLAFNKHSHKY